MAPTNGWGMNPAALHAAGKKVAGYKQEASTAATGFLTALNDAKAAVHHPRLVSALDTYHGQWTKPANQLPVDIESVGNKISNTAVVGVEADTTATKQVSTPTATNPDPQLRRGINIPVAQ